MSHTPGPWILEEGAVHNGMNVIGYPTEGGSVVIARTPAWPMAADEMACNTRLIAAAPEMLALLNGILEQDIPPSLRVQIDALLARIEGA